jgi:hypothetical protein
MSIKILQPLRYFWILNLGIIFADAESNSSKKSNNEPKEKSIQQKPSECQEAKIEEPETIYPTKKTIRNTITLNGFIEDPDAIPFSIDTQNWTDIRVSSPPIHGKVVKKGEVVMKLDMEKILNHLQFLSHDLNILDLNKEILLAEIKLAEELAPLEKAELDRFEEVCKRRLQSLQQYLPSFRQEIGCHEFKVVRAIPCLCCGRVKPA